MKHAVMRALLIALAVVTASSLLSCSLPDGAEGDAPLRIYCFKAGKADAFAIMTEKHTVILDTGERGFGNSVISYLKGCGRRTIDLIIITHFDKDHVGGAAKIINTVRPKAVMQSNYIKDGPEYEKYTAALAAAGIEPLTVRKTETFEYDGVKFTVDPPAKEDYERDASNNSSLILKIEYTSHAFIFAGDAEDERIAEYVAGDASSDCDVLKMPHHGRWDDNLPELADAVTPEYAVITSSDEKPEDPETVGMLEERGVEVFFTRKAPVLIVCGKDGLTVNYSD